MNWTPVIETLDRANSLVLTTHVGSDGDGIGSELALARALRRRGKTVRIINPTATQERYRFLFEPGELEDFDPAGDHARAVAEADLVAVLDINRWDRLGELSPLVHASPAARLCIDHHPAPEFFGDADLSDPTASATGVLIAELLRELDGRIADDAIDPLYVAIMTDTGSFRFANTNERSMRIAAELVERGARPDQLYRNIYEASSRGRIELLGRVLSSLTFEVDGALVYFTITREMIAECGVERDEVEGFTDIVRAVDGSRIVLSFLETESGGAKISLRSKGESLDVGAIAREFGGGGHANASGILDERPLGDVRPAVLDRVRIALAAPTI